jgi:filamentous hemagglutinin family protein
VNISRWLLLGLFLSLLTGGESATAQIAADRSLGAERSRLQRQVNLFPLGQVDLIDGGARRGTNLFHSFSTFNIRPRERVYFANPSGIENIITRITGSNRSIIQGRLGVDGAANLFLLNPHGIIFGEYSSLDVRGSFLATTADSILFNNDLQFSASNPQSPTLLTISTPIGLQFGSQPGQIINRSGALDQQRNTSDGVEPLGGLQVQPQRSLILAGGGVKLDGGNLVAPEGNITIGSVSGAGQLPLLATRQGYELGNAAQIPGGNIRLSQQSLVTTTRDDTQESGSGDILIQGRRITLENNSQLNVSTERSGQGGHLTVNATDSIMLIGEDAGNDLSLFTGFISDTRLPLNTNSRGGDAGNIRIHTQNLTVRGGAQITSFSFGEGQSGDIFVNADRIVLDGRSRDRDRPTGISSGTVAQQSTAFPNRRGDAGNVRVATRNLSLQNGAQLFSITFGAGDAGNVAVQASAIEVVGTAEYQPSDPNGNTSASDLSRLLGLSQNSDRFSFPSLIATQSEGVGNGGILRLNTNRLRLWDAGQISSTAFRSGQAGNVFVNATESVAMGGRRSGDGFIASGIFSQVDASASGNSGNLALTTQRLNMADGTRISAGTAQQSSGRAGNVSVTADSIDLVGRNRFRVPGSAGQRTFATAISSESLGTAGAGNVTITADTLTIRDHAEVSVRTLRRNANAGNLNLASRSVRLTQQGQLTAETGSGTGGDIILSTPDLLFLSGGSQISTSAGRRVQGGGDGGNITVNTGVLNAASTSNSDIAANAYSGRGGTVNIRSQVGILGIEPRSRTELRSLLNTTNPIDIDPQNLPSNDITAISQLSPKLEGQVNINAPDLDLTRELTLLPTDIIDVSRLVAQGCAVGLRTANNLSELVITGRGGLAPVPTELLNSVTPIAHWITAANSVPNARNSPAAPSPAPVLEAQGWVTDAKGQVQLVADPGTRARLVLPTCPRNSP